MNNVVRTMNAPVTLNNNTVDNPADDENVAVEIAAKTKRDDRTKTSASKQDMKMKATENNSSVTKVEKVNDSMSSSGNKEEPMNNESQEQENDTKDDTAQAVAAEEDEEYKLAMEMAIAAAQNPHLSPAEIQKLVGEKNKQAKVIEEITKKKEEKLKQEQELAAQRRKENSWWQAVTKNAEAMKDRAERTLYAERIKNDPEIIETRKKYKILKKTYKAHRLQGNRVETRHAFKRQRMEKKLMMTVDRLEKTQRIFTHSNYNVQEYLKSMVRSSKKWRKKGSDQELMLEAQLCRNMHQMLALEKQKVKCKKHTKELKKYLQRCKGWLSDKKAFCEMNHMTLDATQNSIMLLYEDTLKRQDALIAKLKATDEFKGVDLSDVDTSKFKFIDFAAARDPERSEAMNAMRGLPITDSIRKKKEQMDREHPERAQHTKQEAAPTASKPESNANTRAPPTAEEIAKLKALKEAQTRNALLKGYFQAKQQEEQSAAARPELFIVAHDDVSVSSRLSDPDASFSNHNEHNEDSSSAFKYGNDAPWLHSEGHLDSVEEQSKDDDHSKENLSEDGDKKPAAKKTTRATRKAGDTHSEDTASPSTSTIEESPATGDKEQRVKS